MGKFQIESIQLKLTLVILAIFVVSLCALGGLCYWEARDIITKNLISGMESTADKTAAEVDDWLNARKNELKLVALDPAILSGNQEAITPYLASVVKGMKGIDGMAFVPPDGSYIGSSGMKGSAAGRDYFVQAMKGEDYISNPRISPAKGNYVTVISVPIKVAGQVTGVLFATVDMEGLTAKVLATKVGKTGYSYVVQSDGLVIVHPNKEAVSKLNTLTDSKISPILRGVTQRMVNGETGSIRYQYSGADRLVAYAPIPSAKWSLGIAAPMEEVTGALTDLWKISLATIFTVLVVTALFILWFARRFAKPIGKLETAANDIAAGNIALNKLGISANDEIGRLAHSFEQMTHNLRTVIKKVLGATEQVAAASEELTASSEQSAQAANQIAASITNVASGAGKQLAATSDAGAVVEKMSASIRQIVADTNQVADQSVQAEEKAQGGDQAIVKVVAQMEQIQTTVTTSAKVVAKLGERSKEIGQIVDTISGIAGQTNLLALNAAIEAARAGEQGRGFAVVAEEVRKLAEQSQDAAKKIAELISEIQGDTEQAVVAMDNGTKEVATGTEVVHTAGNTFREIAGLVTAVSGRMKEISVSIQQLADDSQRIVSAVKTIDELGQNSSGEAQGVSAAAEEQLASMQEIASSSQSLAKLAQDLQSAINEFKV